MNTESVFGVSNEIIKSYVEREQVDGAFRSALLLNKQIVVYGSSKQGKTSLIKKHLPLDSVIMVQCSPTSQLVNIYSSILRQCGVTIQTDHSVEEKKSVGLDGSFKAKINFPFVASAEAGISGKGGTETTKIDEHKNVEYDLGLAQDISEILKTIKFSKYVVLDNFHYLQEEVQKNFAFDLRVFQETDIRFIVLGIWRERNRLTQFNGDLQDRVVEVAVEPWEHTDFARVIQQGSEILNVDFSSIYNDLVESSFDSIGVFQELCKESCLSANVKNSLDQKLALTKNNLQTAVEKKLQEYSGRHLRSFETFANSSSRSRDGNIPLYIPYYFIKVLLASNFDDVQKGFKRKDLHREIAQIHHRPDDVRPSDMSNFLHQITKYQIAKKINPPLFDFDRSINTLKIIDSTLYFFLRNCDKNEVLEGLTPPSDQLEQGSDVGSSHLNKDTTNSETL